MNVKRRFLNKVSLPIAQNTGDIVYWSKTLKRWVTLPAVKYGSFLMSRGIGNSPAWVDLTSYGCNQAIEVRALEWGDVYNKEELLEIGPIELINIDKKEGGIIFEELTGSTLYNNRIKIDSPPQEESESIGLHLSYSIT